MHVTGIVQNHRHKMPATGTIPDHVHILLGLNIAVLCTFGVILQRFKVQSTEILIPTNKINLPEDLSCRKLH
jgi:hypothetical protein